ncbi:MAG: hypothetical protein ACOY4K_15040 [Pseudomonadota bacterium]
MSLTATLVLTAVLVAVGVFAGWRAARPPDLVRGPRMAPWRAIMMISAAGVLVALVHLASLLGLKTDGY